VGVDLGVRVDRREPASIVHRAVSASSPALDVAGFRKATGVRRRFAGVVAAAAVGARAARREDEEDPTDADGSWRCFVAGAISSSGSPGSAAAGVGGRDAAAEHPTPSRASR
jgi:hypothetical protein